MSLFNKVKLPSVKRSAFNLSHDRKFSMNMGSLVPILCEEVVPGDTFRLNTEVFMRMAPMVAPVMHNVNVFTHFFFVPNRIIWNNWQNFITGGEDGQADPVMPYIPINSGNWNAFKAGTLADYLGVGITKELPTAVENINALPFRAYQEVFNEYYRDQNLQERTEYSKADGWVNTPENLDAHVNMRDRNWEKDYFTSALPWTQKGSAVSIPLSGEAPVFADGGPYGVPQLIRTAAGTVPSDGSLTTTSGEFRNNAGVDRRYLDPNGTMFADLDSAGASVDINELRRATKLQQWLERNARGGTRYIEQIMAHFGVKSSDARLQRPEYLGGGKTPVVISEVLQNSSTDGTSPQGNMAGHGMSVGSTHGFKRFFEEHGYIIGIMSVLPRSAYSQGHRRHFLKDDKFEYYWPEFANLGEQPVYDSELYATHAPNKGLSKNGTFGYQSRYSEYKFIPSTVHGDFKILDNGLDKWHMGRLFDQSPSLNETFISADDVTHRIFAVESNDYHKLYVQVYHNLNAVRPMPYFGTPRL